LSGDGSINLDEALLYGSNRTTVAKAFGMVNVKGQPGGWLAATQSNTG
jgi:hypothetical protein